MFYAWSQFRLKTDGSGFNVHELHALSVLQIPLGLEISFQFVGI